jgi:hypothetical protein
MFNRDSRQTTRSRRRGRPSGLLVCAAIVTVALDRLVRGDGARFEHYGADGRIGHERKVRRTDRGGRTRPDAVCAEPRDDASSPMQEQNHERDRAGTKRVSTPRSVPA